MTVPCISVTGKVRRFHEVTTVDLRCIRCGMKFTPTKETGYLYHRATAAALYPPYPE